MESLPLIGTTPGITPLVALLLPRLLEAGVALAAHWHNETILPRRTLIRGEENLSLAA